MKKAEAKAGKTSEAVGRNTGAKAEKKAGRQTKATKARTRATRGKTGDDGATPTSPEATKAPMSGLDAAAKVLAEADEPLRCKEIATRALEAGYWASDGKTPHATVYASIIREIAKKGEESRFVKAGRGLFALAD